MNREKKAVSLPVELYRKIEQRIAGTGFHSVDEYVAFVMEEVLKEEGEAGERALSKEAEEQVKSRLRALGYLD